MYTITFTYFTYLNFITNIRNRIMAEKGINQKNEDNQKDEKESSSESEEVRFVDNEIAKKAKQEMVNIRSQYIDVLAKMGTDVGMPLSKVESIAANTFDVYLDELLLEITTYRLQFGEDGNNYI